MVWSSKAAVRNPLTPRPAVIPRKNRLAQEAAVSAGIPRLRAKKLLNHSMAVCSKEQ